MTADDARRIVDAQETAERTLANLTNLCRQPVAPNDPQRHEHEARIASAGVAYISAEAELQQLMVGHQRGVRVDGPAEPPEQNVSVHVTHSGKRIAERVAKAGADEEARA